MKKIFKYSVAFVSALMMAACSERGDINDFTYGTWDASADYSNVYFETANQTVELDPVEATNFKAQISRRNTSKAATVKLDITTNTDDVFTVSDAVFAAGDSVADIDISFPNAEVGKTYTLTLVSSNAEDVSPNYSKGVSYTLNVTRVKWNPAGYVEVDGQKFEGYAMYTDDIITGFYGVQNVTYPVQIEERDDKPGYFRILDLYKDYPYDHDWDDSEIHYLYIDATNPNKVFIPSKYYSGMALGEDGQIIVFSIAGLRLSQGRPADAEGNYGTYKNGVITFPEKALLIAEEFYNDGGLYQANPKGLTKIVIDPSKNLYTATLEDYDMEPVFEGTFTSAKLDNVTDGIALYKGVRNDSIENANPGCYDRYETNNGVPYVIVNPYAKGYPIYFAVNEKGKVVVPTGYESQPIGIEALNDDVYAVINAGASSFSEREVILNITFQNAKGTVEYGTTDESLAYVVWNKVGTGAYTYNTGFMCEKDEEGNLIPVTDDPAELFQREDKPNTYKLSPWGDGAELIFTWDKETNLCTVPMQPEGYVHPSYGIVYVSDIATWQGDAAYYEDFPCYYDPETTTFILSTAYYVEAGAFGYGTEALEVTWDAAPTQARVASAKKAKKHFGLKLDKSMKMANRFVGKKVNRKVIINESNLVK